MFTFRQAFWVPIALLAVSVPAARSAAPTAELLADIRPGAAQSVPAWLSVTDGGLVYFQAHDGTNGPEGWLPDGSSPALLGALGDLVFFRAQTTAGSELWVSDRTDEGRSPSSRRRRTP